MSHERNLLFLCDQMFARLGKWLRAAGYDTKIVENALKDEQVLLLAIEEKRLLLTRDKHFLKIKAAEGKILYFPENHLANCIQRLNIQLHLNWLFNPFSRCLLCNTLLENPSEHSLENLHLDIRQQHKVFWYCPKCKKIYWQGSHTSHMLEQLQIWQKSGKNL